MNKQSGATVDKVDGVIGTGSNVYISVYILFFSFPPTDRSASIDTIESNLDI